MRNYTNCRPEKRDVNSQIIDKGEFCLAEAKSAPRRASGGFETFNHADYIISFSKPRANLEVTA